MRRIFALRFIIIIVFLLLDWYIFVTLRSLLQNSSEKLRAIVLCAHVTVSIASIIAIFSVSYLSDKTHTRNYVLSFLVMLFVSKVLITLFFLIDDIRRLIIWAVQRITQPHLELGTNEDSTISRSVFLSWIGGVLATLFFGSMAYGFSNKYNYKIKRVKLHFPNLPDAFDKMKILQISDIHSGSFSNKAVVNKGIDMMLNEKADAILFTGDLVNDRAAEMSDYIDIFSRLNAPMGVYSVLGNHDYGDYVEWPTEKAKEDNLEQLKKIQAKMGWRLLMNEHVALEKDGQQIALLGVENWSASRGFSRHGKLNEAHAGTEKYPFKILMSHDPSHWDAEIRPKYPDIDLTLSGHTHGMQFGVELPHFRWSPVKWAYKQWADLYENGNQKIYVNRGYGFIGYPGRVGILPEITIIQLNK